MSRLLLHFGEIAESGRVGVSRSVDWCPHWLTLKQAQCFDVVLWGVNIHHHHTTQLKKGSARVSR